jgi:hypothetical protein
MNVPTRYFFVAAAKNIDTAAIGIVTRSLQTLFRRLQKCGFANKDL